MSTLRCISERVSLAAARAAKSCAHGQQKITTAPRSPDDIATGIGRRESGWTWGDRVTWQGQFWIVQDVRADGAVTVLREGTDLADTVPGGDYLLSLGPYGALVWGAYLLGKGVKVTVQIELSDRDREIIEKLGKPQSP